MTKVFIVLVFASKDFEDFCYCKAFEHADDARSYCADMRKLEYFAVVQGKVVNHEYYSLGALCGS